MSRVNSFIEHSILGILSFLKYSLFAEEYASRKGFLQSIDPRLKALSFLLLVVATLLIRHIFVLSLFYALCLILAWSSKIQLKFFLIRTWFFIPFFSCFIAVPALFSIFSPGAPLYVFNFFGTQLIVTHTGFSAAVLFIARVVTSVSFVVLLGLVTRHTTLLRVLRILGVPQVFVFTLSICYRYIYLFIESIEDVYRAMKSRVGAQLRYKKGQGMVALKIATLWHKSLYLNEEVYKAMLSRGYNGEPRSMDTFKVCWKDILWLGSVAGFIFLTMLLDYFTN